VATVVYSAHALAQIESLLRSRGEEAQDAALHTCAAIRSAVESLATHPLLGFGTREGLRELVISCGRTGYVALYRYLVRRDEVRMLALRTQRDVGLVP
jgi:plasmid stabilization system protein ParE